MRVIAQAAEGRLGLGPLRAAGFDEAALRRVVCSAAVNQGLPSGAIDFMRAINASALAAPAVLKVSESDASRDAFIDGVSAQDQNSAEGLSQWSS